MTPHPGRRRAGRRSLVALLAGVVALLAAAAPAQAAAGYRYWSFWRGTDGGWAYQQQGPAVSVPPDGAVDGWRFAVSPDGGQQAAQPRAASGFAAVCADTPAQPGRKRVAVVLDFGTAADSGSAEAPPEQRNACATVVPNATSAEVLAAVAPPLRYDGNGLLCAIAGFPKAGCAEQLGAAAEPSAPKAGGDGGGPDVGLIAGGALLAVLAGGAGWQARRRRTS